MKALTLGLIGILVVMGFAAGVQAVPYVLTTGAGDGSVNVGVDGYGAFGSSVGADATNAVYDPVGAIGPAGTTFESGVAIRLSQSAGGRTFLTSGTIGGSGGLAPAAVAGTPTQGTSAFSFGGLNFSLVQTVGPLTAGSLLQQAFTITNPGTSTASFEMVRYIDGDLLFDGSLVDGGGRFITGGGVEFLFETDTAAGTNVATTFVGITATGGTIPVVNRYEVDSFSGLRGRIIAGNALDNTITGDGGDLDQFIDAGGGYDVTLALRNLYTLEPGQTATYQTDTYFGSGSPEQVEGIPEPVTATLGLMGLTSLALAISRRRPV